MLAETLIADLEPQLTLKKTGQMTMISLKLKMFKIITEIKHAIHTQKTQISYGYGFRELDEALKIIKEILVVIYLNCSKKH